MRGVRTKSTEFKAMSYLARCLTHADMKSLHKERGSTFVMDTPTGKVFKKMVSVDVGGRHFWADPVTGSLFDPATGGCLSTSAVSLFLDTVGIHFADAARRFPGLQKKCEEKPSRSHRKSNTPPGVGAPTNTGALDGTHERAVGRA